jgi:general secretion pathway protein H
MNSGARAQAGFTLLELTCMVAIIAMLAAVLLPNIPQDTSRPRLEGYVIATASLLKADRTAAIRRHAEIATQVDAVGRTLRSGSTERILRVPDDVHVGAILPKHCNERPAFSTINFFANGMSCGGTIILSRFGIDYEIRVNWLTGGIEIVQISAS